jgi:hypothetical protein
MTSTQVAPLVTGTGGESPAVTVRGRTKSYAGRAVVDGLDLEVRRGECLALRGPIGVVSQGEGTGPALSVREPLDHLPACSPDSASTTARGR